MLELLGGPLVLAGCFELGGQGVAQVDEQLDVEGGIGEPGGGQRPGGPVRCRVVLGQAQAQGLLDDGAQSDVLSPQEAGCQLGVEQGVGSQPECGQAGDVLVGGMEDPLGSVEGRGQLGQRAAGHRVDEKGADAVSSELDEVGVLSVAEAGGPFGVNGDGALAIRQKLSGSAQLGGGGGDLGEPVLGAGVVDDVVRADGTVRCPGEEAAGRGTAEDAAGRGAPVRRGVTFRLRRESGGGQRPVRGRRRPAAARARQ